MTLLIIQNKEIKLMWEEIKRCMNDELSKIVLF